MTNDSRDIAALGTDQLIQRFGANATRLGYAWDLNAQPQLKPGMPEHDAVVKELKAVARELRARDPVAQVRPLYESEHRSVRSFASTLLATVDPGLAWAALRSAEYDLPTDQVTALLRRVRTEPPARPSFAEMTVDALLDRFVDATTRLYATRFLDCIGEMSDMDIRNRIVTEKGDILRELKARGALERLLPLFDHPNLTVRTQAATACLAIDTQRALAILEAFPKDGEFLEKCDVNYALERFRQGKGVIWGVV